MLSFILLLFALSPLLMTQPGAVLNAVKALPFNKDAQGTLDRHGLRAYTVTWEDTARQRGSAVGPNITDLTLTTGGTDLPIIRRENFADLTWDSAIDAVQLRVGNEHGEPLRTVSLRTLLANPADYLSDPHAYEGASLVDEKRDVNVLMSAQACLLPVSLRDGEKTPFAVTVRNYQSRPGSPAVLVIVAGDDGTSCHVINTNGKETLYYNKNGERCQLLGERLGTYRRAQGRPDDGAPMTKEEQAKNALLVIQVPLVQSRIYGRFNTSPSGTNTFAKAKTSPAGGISHKSGGGFGGSGSSSNSNAGASSGGSFNGGGTQPAAGPAGLYAGFAQWDQTPEMADNVALPEGFSSDDDGDTPAHAPASGKVSQSWFLSAKFDNDDSDVVESGGKKFVDAWFSSPASDDDDDDSDVESDGMEFDLFGNDGEPAPAPKVEHAIVSVGPPEGPYDELCGQGIQRDFTYPIRVTVQFYRATTSGTLPDALAKEISDQFAVARAQFKAVAVGSLVVGPPATERTTAPHRLLTPAWWPTFCDTYWPQLAARYPTREAAAAVAFKKGRFLKRGMQDATAEVLAALRAGGGGGKQ